MFIGMRLRDVIADIIAMSVIIYWLILLFQTVLRYVGLM